MGQRPQGQLGDKHHQLLPVGKALGHKIEGKLQCGAGSVLGSHAAGVQLVKTGFDHRKGSIGAGALGLQHRPPAAQQGGSFTPGGKGALVQQVGGGLLGGFGLEGGKQRLVQCVCTAVGRGGKRFFIVLQHRIAQIGHRLQLGMGSKAGVQSGQHQPHQRQPLVKGGVHQPGVYGRLYGAVQNILYPVIVLIAAVQRQIGGKLGGHLLVLQVLGHQFFVGLQPQCFVRTQQVGQILPAAGSNELGAFHIGVHPVKMGGVQLQIT